jgi:hypothetical protein
MRPTLRALPPSLLVILCPLLAACGGSGGGSGNPYDAAAQSCVDTINQLRSTLGVAPYAPWTDGEVCANGQAQSDSASGAAHGAFGACQEHAQDECPGWPGPADKMIGPCLMAMWAEGPGTDFTTHGHYINMSSTAYTKVACGFYTLPDGSVWATQNFE